MLHNSFECIHRMGSWVTVTVSTVLRYQPWRRDWRLTNAWAHIHWWPRFLLHDTKRNVTWEGCLEDTGTEVRKHSTSTFGPDIDAEGSRLHLQRKFIILWCLQGFNTSYTTIATWWQRSRSKWLDIGRNTPIEQSGRPRGFCSVCPLRHA